jgi:hypothetical protein
MLDDPRFAYQQIGSKFGFTRQYIAQFAKEFGVDGRRRRRQREHSRMLHRVPRIIKVNYPPGIRAVIDKVRRSGIRVTPYIFPAQQSAPYLARRAQTMVLANGRLCTIQFRKGRELTRNGREYVRFDTTVRIKRAKFALWATRSGRALKVYVIPLTDLRNVSSVYLPAGGKYAFGSKKTRKDWTRYERAWHLLGNGGRERFHK